MTTLPPDGTPAVTILLPLKHYHPVFLSRALASVRDQTSGAWRLLIIVDRKARAMWEPRLAAVLGDPRVTIVANEGRKLAGKLNTGMRRASTEFVTVLFGDDVFSNDTVALLAEYIARFPQVDFFHSSRRAIDEEDRPISGVYPSIPEVRLDDFPDASPVRHLLCWRRAKALSFGGMDESLNSVGADDWDFPWCMAEAGAVFHAIPECLYVYRDHRASYRLTTHLPRSVHEREIRRILEKHGVPPDVVRRRVTHARETYLRQCLYRNRLEAWVRERFGLRPRKFWWQRLLPVEPPPE